MTRLFLLALITVSLIGCGGGGDGTSDVTLPGSETENLTDQQKIAYLEDTGAIPRLDRSNSLEGVDANLDGIRDDVESFINFNYAGIDQRNAARQFASTLQEALLVNEEDLDAAKAVSIKITRAVNCIYSRFDGTGKEPFDAVRDIESVTTNTKERLLQYLAFAKALDGTSSALPEGDTCE